ncbi:flagellar MS-ring protein [Acetobacter nitrogenifigens DSM 23921 = NBRC 105050]|uniref:Flagellar M-ring protein n=1 Tax=Acetobacter nitrogenifigens DSM 23921 = NBRC 105050 TaxID=1120919 RepID=A0A511X5Z9_9PROT|nr:flagellar basal-body MS-ring/collar protein FliF [Acetobacter nitrogenifigens]GBQ96337.1 flagellar MS-ring protein [Acetobacter nitrogenifigens DSM 23921 = NBRC 105050]GEN58371.1 flagellar M-ring protein [Acetobacter nitrogenifigens DSM 23921 = NBRC 105050]
MKDILASLRSLGVPRLITLGVVAVGLLGLLGALALRGSQEPMSLLYRDLDLHEAAQMAEDLDKAHIQHVVSPQGDSIQVPRDQIAAARLLLARDGLPSGGSVGYEIFDHANSMTTTQFEQNIQETRALEGELERSIRLIRGVRGVRVHLVLPHRELFSTERQAAQASVLLTMGGGRLDAEGVQAVLNLVAAAVPDLSPDNISVVDNRGDVLAKAGDKSGARGEIQAVEEQRRAMETHLAQTVETMLAPALGASHVRAEASVTMNLDEVRDTQESYDPDQQVLRSQQTTTDKSVNTDAQPNVTVSNNLPNANAGQAKSGSQNDRREETNNYEIGKRVKTLVQTQPRLQRISLAVIVDGVTRLGADGKPVWTPLDAATIDRVTTLAKSAIGYDEKRGDVVNVVSMKFSEEAPSPVEIHGWLGTSFDRADVMHIVQSVLPGLLVFLALIFFARPLLRKSIAVAAVNADVEASLSGQDVSSNALASPAAQASQALAYEPVTQLALTGPDEGSAEFVSLAGIDGRLKASAIKRVRDLAISNPEESLNILRTWLTPQLEG